LDETADTEDEDPLVGQLLDDRYEIQKSLDRGGMGTVYLAWDRGLERQVVVKIPHARLMADRTFRLRFLQEIRDLANHEHPAILRIEASGSHGDVPYAVVQYLRGGNLRERITEQGGQQTVDEILEWLPTIADALDTVHKNGSLHRDVKPANILFDASGNAILSDFGIATAIGAADPDAPTQEVRRELTVVGTFVGSPAYAPPEAIDRILTPAYDQYSLATVVYLALAGELPFSGQTNEAILIAKERNTPPKLDRKKLKGPVSAAAEKALMKALSRKPEDRFESCTEFANAFASGHQATASASRRGLAAIVAGLVGLGALLFFVLQVDWKTETAAPPVANPASGADEASQPEDTNVAVTSPEFPVTVELGSTPQEIDRAISLCKQGGGDAQDCARATYADERLRTVTLAPFEIDRTEVTNAAFERFVQATGYQTTAEERGYSWDITRCRRCSWRTPRPDRLASDHPNDPVVHVSWTDARAYCEWADSRLPTEDEWEYSARGRDRRTFPWGNEWDAGRLRDIHAKGLGLEPVGSHPTGATPEGIQDMAGSVWEWTSTPSGNKEKRIEKGGSWSEEIPSYFRSAAFTDDPPDYSGISTGFRCARDLES
jgi:serine/threonine-protein kinase